MRVRRSWIGAISLIGAAAIVAAGCSSGEDASTTTAGAPSTTAVADGGEVELLSYNVAGLPQEVSGVEPAEHIPLISPLLEDYEVVLTQEDFDWWGPEIDDLELDFREYHERLRADVTHEFRTERHPGPEAVGIDVATERPTMLIGDGLGLLSRLPFGDVDRVPWERCFGGMDTSDGGAADCLAMKGFLVTELELAPGVPVVLVNLHAEAGSTAVDRRASAAGFRQLAAYLVEHAEGKAIILGGDTNLHTDRELDAELTTTTAAGDEPVLSDGAIWDELLEATALTEVCDVLACDDPHRIDRFLFRSSDELELEPIEQAFEAERFVDAEGDPLSDHEALMVRFAWRRVGG